MLQPNEHTDDGPPLDGTGGVRFDDVRGHWVRRTEDTPPHECMPPMTGGRRDVDAMVAYAREGDLWRCRCGVLWECYEHPQPFAVVGPCTRPQWRRAGLWLMLRHFDWWGRLDTWMWAMAGLAFAASVLLVVLAWLGLFP